MSHFDPSLYVTRAFETPLTLAEGVSNAVMASEERSTAVRLEYRTVVKAAPRAMGIDMRLDVVAPVGEAPGARENVAASSPQLESSARTFEAVISLAPKATAMLSGRMWERRRSRRTLEARR